MPVEAWLAGLFGLLIGSFLNVCIYRWPRDLSVVRPRSRCCECEAPIAAWDNIPLVSYLVLRGRCRHCRAAISMRYPLVELLTAVLFAYFIAKDGATLIGLRDCIYSAILLGLVFTDLETRILPDPLTFGGIGIGLLFAWLTPTPGGLSQLLFGLDPPASSLVDALAAAIIPAGALWLTGWLYQKVRKVDGLGFGDVVMLAEVGVFLGLQRTLLALMLASIAGSVIGLIWIVAARKKASTYELPLGSFLGGAAIFVMAFGRPLISWYLARF